MYVRYWQEMATDSLMKLVYCWSRIEKPGSMLLKCICATANVGGEHQGSRRALSFHLQPAWSLKPTEFVVLWNMLETLLLSIHLICSLFQKTLTSHWDQREALTFGKELDDLQSKQKNLLLATLYLWMTDHFSWYLDSYGHCEQLQVDMLKCLATSWP